MVHAWGADAGSLETIRFAAANRLCVQLDYTKVNGEPSHVAYCASKGAVLQITRCMALDHAQENIRVNAVCPGEIHTQMVDDILASKGGNAAENLKALASGIPMRRLASPAEVGRCVRFLASEEASYVTGTALSVDGGNDATAGPYP